MHLLRLSDVDDAGVSYSPRRGKPAHGVLDAFSVADFQSRGAADCGRKSRAAGARVERLGLEPHRFETEALVGRRRAGVLGEGVPRVRLLGRVGPAELEN